MAKMVVDRLVEREGRQAPCRTAEIPLGAPVSIEELPELDSIGEAERKALAARYGHAAVDVLALAAERPELAEPIVPGLPDLMAEVVIAARREQARGVADVLLRRTRLGLIAAGELLSEPQAGRVQAVAQALGGELGWDRARVAGEIDRFHAEARAEGMVR